MIDLIKHPIVSIAAPSITLLNDMKDARTALDSFQIPYELSIVAAHRAPRKTLEFVAQLEVKEIEGIWVCTPTRYDSFAHNHPCHRSSSSRYFSGRNGFVAFNDTNAKRRSCGNCWDKRCL